MIFVPAVRLVNVGDATPKLLKIRVFFVPLYRCRSPFTVSAPEDDDRVFDDVPSAVVFVILTTPEELVVPEMFTEVNVDVPDALSVANDDEPVTVRPPEIIALAVYNDPRRKVPLPRLN